MEKTKKAGVGVFSLLALLFVIMAGTVLVRVYMAHDFPIFTDEDQINAAKDDAFGILANYI